MLELTDWFRRSGFPPKPWLVLGKGPTFDRRAEFDLGAYNLLALNHVVNEMRVDVAHAIDIDVVADCADRLESNCDWLLMPRYPHVRSTYRDRMLEDYFEELPVLRSLAEQDRLVWYNLSHSPLIGDSPVIGASRFSSEAALNLLGRMGATTVRSLGVDGGRSYAPSFAQLEEATLLANGALDFHLQFERLEVIAEEFSLDYRPLVEPLRIFVGADESQLVPYRVLEYSIRCASSIPVEIAPMFDVVGRTSPGSADRTRWPSMIPALCGFHGRALYLDADTLVLGDVAELATLPFGDSPLRQAGSTVMLIDCERGGPALDAGAGGRSADPMPPPWCASGDDAPNRTKLLDFAGMATQPWRDDDHPLREVWMEPYREAVQSGAVPPEEVESMIAGGHASGSLRAALRFAPSRRSAFTNAARDLNAALRRIAALEQQLEAIERSMSWRIGSAIVRSTRAPAKLWRGGSGGSGTRRVSARIGEGVEDPR